MNECRVASSVRSLDLDVSLDHLNANIGCRCRCYGSGNARAHQEGCKVAPCDVSGMRLLRRLAFLIICHGFFVQRVYRISLADRTACYCIYIFVYTKAIVEFAWDEEKNRI